MLLQYPDVSAGLVMATNPVTMVKLSAFFVALPTLVVGVVVVVIKWFQQRKQENALSQLNV
ncbi:MAG: hypothetical protein ACNA8H_13040 [Anaerolineales bacterium]